MNTYDIMMKGEPGIFAEEYITVGQICTNFPKI
jgi:hypothetical protein